MEIIFLIFALASGCCLAAVQLRKKERIGMLWEQRVWNEFTKPLEPTDKKLLIFAAIFFVIAITIALIEGT